MTDSSPSSGGSLAADLLARANEKVAQLQAQLKEEQALQRFLDKLVDHLDGARPAEALRHLRNGAKSLGLLRSRSAELSSALDTFAADLQKEVEGRFADLVTAFPEALTSAGCSVDADSRHPRYTVHDHLIEVKVDKARLEAWVTPRDGKRRVVGADASAMADLVSAEATRLLDRPYNAAETLDLLVGAYRQAVEETKASDGDSVPIKKVIALLAKEKGVRPDEFNVDLSRLARDKESTGRFKLENTRDAREGILLWQLDQRGYYGYLKVGS